jgi:hypothetical protein
MAAASQKKRPGGMALPAEPGSHTNPSKDMAMNSRNDTTTAGLAPDDHNPVTLNIEPGLMETMSPEDLKALTGALRTMLDVGSGIVCQPRFWKDDSTYTAAGNAFECVNEALGKLIDSAHKAAVATTPTSSRDAKHRAWCLLQIRSDYEDDLNEVAVQAVEAVRDVDNWKKKEARLLRTAFGVPA